MDSLLSNTNDTLSTQCGDLCFRQVAGNSSCVLEDLACFCTDTVFLSQVHECLQDNCNNADRQATLDAALAFCGRGSNARDPQQAALVTLFVFSLLILASRFVSGAFTHVTLWWDDLANVGAMSACLSNFIVLQTMISTGAGHDTWSLTPDDVAKIMAGVYAFSITYIMARLLIRLSILLFFLRIFDLPRAKPVFVGTMVLVTMEALCFLCLSAFHCRPIAYTWQRWTNADGGQCLDGKAIAYSSSIIGLVVDFGILFAPLAYIPRLKLRTVDKLWAFVMFQAGISLITMSILRFRSIETATRSKNLTADMVPALEWSALEIYSGLVLCSLPGLHTVLKFIAATCSGRY
ncbi:hypothetical protein S40293_10434 [Stachybotrys chartarum IBT 40293]|nr:hypothetical protein S40293_10434 [Stachybotrys chartarum IBT 40293]